ncbi:hypothetical protein TNCV_2484831 [Trichonephila clavipes]|uniref:Uncharacterized protein n=1 Tax=Trichonephila clavipes TaxID=2585209 RepID=A0A8X6VZI1_TRICX|nr:hypothetical protein TNCV_2484831 [Trichonephila clavipes]
MDICKCILPLWHGGTLRSRRAASLHVRLTEERWELPNQPFWLLSLGIGVESSQITLSSVWCSKLRITTGLHLAHFHDEFCEPRSDTVNKVSL